jgi:ankyrin repeat protein
LHFAALTGSIGNALSLIQAGANLNSKDNIGNTPMHLAIMQENLELVKVLHQHGGDASIKNFEGQSGLEMSK